MAASTLRRVVSVGDNVGKGGLASVAAAGGSPSKYSAIGPKAGAKLLASDEGQAAQKHANTVPDDVTITSSKLDTPASPPAVVASPTKLEQHEGDIHALTKRASAEDKIIKADGASEAARERKASVDKGLDAGLASPYQSPTKPTREVTKELPKEVTKELSRQLVKDTPAEPSKVSSREKEPEKERRGPPVSGQSFPPRQRKGSTASASSTGSISKDHILNQLAEALKKEQKRCKLYSDEINEVEKEIVELDSDMEALKEKYENIFKQQKATIGNLRVELEEVQAELEAAYDLPEAEAATYLSLLSSYTASSVSVARSNSRFTEGLHAEKKSSVWIPKRMRIARRVDAKIAIADSDSDKATSKKETAAAPRRRRLSKTRQLSMSIGPPFPVIGSSMLKKNSTKEHEEEKSKLGPKLREDGQRRRPPVSGHAAPPRPESPVSSVRSRKNSFTKGMATTLRYLFPSNSPGPRSGSQRSRSPSTYQDDTVPSVEQLSMWLKNSEGQQSHMTVGRSTAVGRGVGNPFVSAGGERNA